MEGNAPQDDRSPGIRLYFILAAACWSLLVSASLGWNLWHSERTALDGARLQARIAFDKDVLYRRWNAIHGGVYAPVTPVTRPNPLLKVPEREIQTPDGKQLTKINPAYMTRQVHELGAEASGVLGHITSLKPLRPQNKPDAWEEAALKQVHQGAREVSGVQTVDGVRYLRLIRPLITEKPCLNCHAEQGYQEGDIRGGISVSVPLEPALASLAAVEVAMVLTHIGLWLAGLLGLRWGYGHLARRVVERDQAIEDREEALAQVVRLQALLPVCAGCGRLRDDEAYGQEVESYLQEHPEAGSAEGLCPDCTKSRDLEQAGDKD
jgi:hypothetical protein